MNIQYALKILKENNYLVEATWQQYCMNCGAQVDPHDNYCTTCGEELEEDDDVGSKEEAETELGKLNITHNNFCVNCGTEIDNTEYDTKYCTNCGEQLKNQDKNNQTFKEYLDKFVNYAKEAGNIITVRYGIKDGYYKFIIDASKVEEKIANLMQDKSDDANSENCKKIMAGFKKALEKLKVNKIEHLRFKNSKFYYECKVSEFDLHELNTITKIILEYILNSDMIDNLNYILK